MIESEQLIHNLCTQGFYIIDDFLDLSECHSLLDTARKSYEQGLFRRAKIGLKLESHKNDIIRSDEIFWLNENETNPAIQIFLEKIKQLARILNESLFWVCMNSKPISLPISPELFIKNMWTNLRRKKPERFLVCII